MDGPPATSAVSADLVQAIAEARRGTIAFLLGAGFSKAIAPHFMPITDGLGESVLRVQKAIHGGRRQMHVPECDGLSCDFPQLVDGRWPGESFEQWLSTLAEEQPFRLGPENARARALADELLGIIATEIVRSTVMVCRHHASEPWWFAPLIQRWHDERSNVIAFNYDTLVEARFDALEVRPIPTKIHKLDHRHLLPFRIPRWNTYQVDHPAQSFRYLKLHGSISWYWDHRSRSAESMIDVDLPARWGQPDLEALPDPRERAPGRVPVIVPPTASKAGFFDNPLVRQLWRDAFDALRAAEQVVVIGYSVPTHDTLVASMLAEAARDRPGLPTVVVNPDKTVKDRLEALGLSVVKRFKSMEKFASHYLDQPADEGDQAPATA